ncbi:Uncharacterised protein [Mycobacterium tuberculosis]|uniref:Uncharacterized protein n=3 Tax=Mycobacterium tuberculosis TaxID=1773 RepID=A0A654ZEW6_MYCTX|nr:Uncharacterised protein [Mycobacterium tuberculosis]CKQ23423.1 Uncharacterised protein [Mycobacterium tuberculosis]CKR56195.1 Uncharacterised protein [Mycobacterium tuberculosis]CKS18933.1 Uncharacterised protein [Mycobacterium tuberculosis]CKT22182.1 Uncharacterised protein [Mycobacterium tuberculosis]
MQQCESLRRPDEREHFVTGSAMTFSDRVLRPVHIVGARIAGQLRQQRGELPDQPFRGPVMADVDGEVQHAGRDILITVVARRGKRASV